MTTYNGNIFLIKYRSVAQGIFIRFTIIEYELTLANSHRNKYLFVLGLRTCSFFTAALHSHQGWTFCFP